MERVESSPDDYIASQDPDIRTTLEELHTLIKTALPDRDSCMWEGVFWGGSEQQIIGYGNYSYQRSDKKQVRNKSNGLPLGWHGRKITSVCMSMQSKVKIISLRFIDLDSVKSKQEKAASVFAICQT